MPAVRKLLAPAVLAMASVSCGAPARAAMPTFAGPLECVAALRDVHAGSGDRTFASHYVFAGFYAYGEWIAGIARGQSLWDRRGRQWCKIDTGAEVLDEAGIERHGVAPETARMLIARMRSGAQLAPPLPLPTAPPLPRASHG
jgi:hypothetical protein